MSSLSISCSWELYLHLQNTIDSCMFNRSSMNTREEVLSEVLNDLADGRVFLHSKNYDKRLRNLSLNRSAKYRHRSQLEQNWATQSETNSRSWDHSEMIAARELLNLIREQVSQTDWQILTEIAEGDSYREVATRLGLTIGNLKSRIHRIRNKVRDSLATIGAGTYRSIGVTQ